MAAITVNNPTLVALSGPLKGKKFLIKKEFLTLGNAGDSDISIPGDKVSRNHAAIEKDQFGVWNIISKSEIGILVNKNSTDRASLSIGDLIQIGELTLLKFDGKLSKSSMKTKDSSISSADKIKIKKPIIYLLFGYLILMLAVGFYLSIDKTNSVETGLSSNYLQKVLNSTKEHLINNLDESTTKSSGVVLDKNRDLSALYYNIKNSENQNLKDAYVDNLMNELQGSFFRAWKFEQTGQFQSALKEYKSILYLVPDNEAATTKVANWRIDIIKKSMNER